jgi:rRNA-processing protein FCF1
MIIFDFSIDFEDELTRLLGKYQIVVPRPIIEELQVLSEKGKGKKKIQAKASLKLLEKYDVIDVYGKRPDESVLFLAQKYKGIVLTNDKELKKKAKESSLHTVFLREKNKLALE